MPNIVESRATRLCVVRTQFLLRLGLSFSELLELLNPLFFGRRLASTNAKRSKVFIGQISEMLSDYKSLTHRQ
jgi:hypothetical protein